MKNFNVDEFICLKGKISTAKTAVILSMLDDARDEELVDYFKNKNISCVITRAGGRGDNLKDKLFRNSLTAAENAGLVDHSSNFKYLFFNMFEKIFKKLDNGTFSISGAGFKIGIVRFNNNISVAVSGKVGIPGLNIDYDVLQVNTEYIK
ncbi:MAG: HutP family protein [Candidatus Muiribacteriota bacterium]